MLNNPEASAAVAQSFDDLFDAAFSNAEATPAPSLPPTTDFIPDDFEEALGVQFVQANSPEHSPPHAAPPVLPVEPRTVELSRFGFAMTSSGGLTGPGLASVGGDDAFAFNSIDELRDVCPGVLFVTCASPSNFSTSSGLRRPSLRDASFFPTPIAALVNELGLRLSVTDLSLDGPSAATAATLSEVLTRAMRVLKPAISTHLLSEAGIDIATLLSRTLCPAPATLVPPHPELAPAAKALRKFALPLAGEAGSNDFIFRLPMARVEHMQSVLSCRMPCGEWQEVAKSNIHLDRWYGNNAPPVVAKVSIKGTRGMGAAAFGRVGRNMVRMMSAWLTGPELIALMPSLNLSVDRMFYCSDECVASSALHTDFIDLPPLASGSISAGLAAEALTVAACEGSVHANDPVSSGWVSSFARSKVISEVMPLIQLGVSILEIAPTYALVSVPRSALTNVRSFMLGDTKLRMPAGWRA